MWTKIVPAAGSADSVHQPSRLDTMSAWKTLNRFSQSFAPVVASKATTRSPSVGIDMSYPPLMNRRPPMTSGADRPPNGAFQSRFCLPTSVTSNESGRPTSVE